jgi:hypothetical protein
MALLPPPDDTLPPTSEQRQPPCAGGDGAHEERAAAAATYSTNSHSSNTSNTRNTSTSRSTSASKRVASQVAACSKGGYTAPHAQEELKRRLALSWSAKRIAYPLSPGPQLLALLVQKYKILTQKPVARPARISTLHIRRHRRDSVSMLRLESHLLPHRAPDRN